MTARDRYGGPDVVRKHPKPRRRDGVPDDSTLLKLWRVVVRQEWGGRCALALFGECSGALECHHVIRRARPHLRYSPANGILLCQRHHGLVELSPSWKQRVSDAVGPDKMEWLETHARKLFPEFLRERGQTRSGWLKETKAYLTKLKESDRVDSR